MQKTPHMYVNVLVSEVYKFVIAHETFPFLGRELTFLNTQSLLPDKKCQFLYKTFHSNVAFLLREDCGDFSIVLAGTLKPR